MNVVFLSNIWPQRNLSAACNRVFGLLHVFLKNGWKIDFVCCSKISKSTETIKQYLEITPYYTDPADYKETTSLFMKLKNKPDVAIFDTFIAEEKFSHYINKTFPNCLQVLDLQDFHSLRLKRGEFVEKNSIEKFEKMHEVLKIIPNPKEDSVCARELASIFRSDLVITCSDYEQYILKNHFNIEHSSLITFFYSNLFDNSNLNPVNHFDFDLRKHFVWLGNFGHPPNVNALNNLIKNIWPLIKEKLPKAELHIYGANFRKEFSNLTKIDSSIKSMGLMKNLEVMSYYKALLAPLQFGAGIKGKITDSWYNYLPVITTPLGAEGMFENTFNNCSDYKSINLNSKFFKEEMEEENNNSKKEISKEVCDYYNYEINLSTNNLVFGGSFNNFTCEDFSENSSAIYNNQDIWTNSVKNGRKILEKRMSFRVNEILLMRKISEYQSKLTILRKKNHIQALTWSETLRSTENFAKYIAEKNKKN